MAPSLNEILFVLSFHKRDCIVTSLCSKCGWNDNGQKQANAFVKPSVGRGKQRCWYREPLEDESDFEEVALNFFLCVCDRHECSGVSDVKGEAASRPELGQRAYACPQEDTNIL